MIQKCYVKNSLSLPVERIKHPPSNICVLPCFYIHFKIWTFVHKWLPVGKCGVLLHTKNLQGWVGGPALP